MAGWQKFGRMPTDDALADTLERLRGYSAEADVWLNDLIEARHAAVDTRKVDEAIAVNGFAWTGRGRGVVTIMPLDDLALLDAAGDPARPQIEGAFRDRTARYSFHQLVDASGQSTDAFSDALWNAVWAGGASADSLAVLRAGSARDYTLGSTAPAQPQAAGPPHASAQRHRSVARRHARSAGLGWPGHWFLLPDDPRDDDPLTALETAKDRVRILLDRYGVVCREFANREGGGFRWAALFRALRIMELSGEIVSGLFFQGLSGPQFAAPAALRSLERGAGAESFWVNATDPVAPTGLGVDWPYPLPHRRAGNYLALYRGALVLTAENYGRRLNFAPDLDDAAFAPAIALLTHLLTVRRKVPIDSIDGASPNESRYLTRLADVFDVTHDHRRVELVFPARRIG
jgi:ATP-dependent Lhr-like helicase